jgi:hypothetical protein
MTRKLFVVVALSALIVTLRAQDARAVLRAATEAMGAGNVKTIQYSGTGWNAAVGQSYSPADDWPRFEVTRYTRTIDYDGKCAYRKCRSV